MNPGFVTSLVDAVKIARFELIRAVRTWQALAVVALYLVTTGGSVYLFVDILRQIENTAAHALGVPPVDYPGTLSAVVLAEDGALRGVITDMVGSASLVDHLLEWPVLAIFHLWLGIVLMPFLAAFSSADSIAMDVRSRAIRFELLRTGRAEVVAGRFVGQVLLIGLASLLAGAATWSVGMATMVGNDPIGLAGALAWLGLRAWAFSVPFVGVGVLCSQLTTSAVWARVLAVIATGATWVGYGMTWMRSLDRLTVVADAAQQGLPQGWIRLLWEPGASWLVAAAMFAAMGLATSAAGLVVFGRRDL